MISPPRVMEGKTVLITGASRGVGRVLAVTFAQAGAAVWLTARSKDGLEETAGIVREAGGSAHSFPADLRHQNEVRSLYGEIAAAGPLHSVVNNAGESRGRPFLELTLDEWDDILSLNLTSCFLSSFHALPLLQDQKDSAIVNIASGAGLRGLPENAAYAAAKAGVIALTHSLAEECRASESGVRVNAIAPGPLDTESAALSPNRDFHEQMGHHRLPAEDVAMAALFLASSKLSGSVNSQIIGVRDSNRW